MPILGLGRKKSGVVAPAAPAMARPSAAKAPTLPPPRALPHYGDDELVSLLELAEKREWLPLRARLTEHSGYDLSSLAGNLCAASPGIRDWLPEQLVTDGDALALAVLGTLTIERAWAIRTTQRAEHVSQDQFRQFHEVLREADEHLYASVELDPASVLPWYSLMITGRGLQVGPEVQRRRFETATARDPAHYGLYKQMLDFLLPKWFGSVEQANEFVAEALRGPHRENLGELAPSAQLELWAALKGGDAGRKYLEQESIRAQLLEAAELSLFNTASINPRRRYLLPNAFAMAFSLAGLHKEAVAAFERTEGVVTSWPWSYMSGTATEAYVKRRDFSLQRKK